MHHSCPQMRGIHRPCEGGEVGQLYEAIDVRGCAVDIQVCKAGGGANNPKPWRIQKKKEGKMEVDHHLACPASSAGAPYCPPCAPQHLLVNARSKRFLFFGGHAPAHRPTVMSSSIKAATPIATVFLTPGLESTRVGTRVR